MVLDNDILKENVNSLKKSNKAKKAELELKKEEQIKLIDLYTNKIRFLRNEFKLQDNIKNDLKNYLRKGHFQN